MGATQQVFASYGSGYSPPGNRYFIEGTDQLWSNPDNWWLDDAGTQPAGGVPTAFDDVIIQSGVCTEDSVCNSLTVSAGATLTTNNGTVAENDGTITTNNGTVTTNNDEAVVGTNSATGEVTNNGINAGSTATVNYNAGTIVNCYGPVINENGGTIINDYR